MSLELKQSLSLKLQQQLVMTPQLQLAIKLLQLNRLELNEMVVQQMLENPMLEEERSEAETPQKEGASKPLSEPQAEAPVVEPSDQNNLDIPWEAMAESYAYQPPGSNIRQGQDELPGYDQTLTRSATLTEHLMWQLQLSEFKEIERDIAARIIGDLDEYGYLIGGTAVAQLGASPASEATGGDGDTGSGTTGSEAVAPVTTDLLTTAADGPSPGEAAPEADDATNDATNTVPDWPEDPADASAPGVIVAIAQELEVPISWIEHVRLRVMRFDPLGVASLDLRECLLTQLDALGYDEEDLPFQMVQDFLKEIENRNYKAIARKLKVSMEEIGDALKIITQLEPRPGRSFADDGAGPEAQYITPDIHVYKIGDDYAISLNEDGLPKLRISRFYRRQLKEAQSRGETKSYIRDKLRSATWLIRSIHQRQRTIYRVMESILKFQREFFDRGVEHLKPMVLQDVARDIGMHESTISRVTSHKYVHTPQGIFELKYFFNSPIRRTHGEDVASESVKNIIKQLVTEEDPHKPLSDARIVALLKQRNIEIARRTVAKYRDVMGILSSSKRKKIF